MAERKSIFANVSALGAGQILAAAAGFFTHAILARAVGPDDYGILGLAIAVVSYFGIFSSLGIDTWASREIAYRRDAVRAITASALTLRLALGVAAFAALLLLVATWRPPATFASVLVLQGFGLVVAAITLDYAFQGIERMQAAARRQILAALLTAAGVAASLNLGGGIVAAAAAMTAATAIAAAAMLWEFSRQFGFPQIKRAALANVRAILRDAAPLAVTGLLVTIYTYVDIVMLGFFRPGAEVGYYVAAVRVLAIGLLSSGILRAAILPILARLAKDAGARDEAGHHFAIAAMTLGGLAACGGIVLAPEILDLIFGAQFREASAALRILMINLIFVSIVEIVHTKMVAWRLQKQQMWIVAFGTVLNIGLNLILIPRYGMEGAAWATLITTVALVALSSAILRRHGYETHLVPIARLAMLSAFVAALGLWLDIPIDGTLPRFLAIGFGLTTIYGALALALRFVRPIDTARYFTRT